MSEPLAVSRAQDRRDLRPAWSEAQRRIRLRIDDTAGTVGPGFPHYADPTTGHWVTTPNGDWTGGFWNGMLWLAYATERDERNLIHAERWTSMLEPRVESETIFRGFLFYYGAALGAMLVDDRRARETALRGAYGLASLYNPSASVIPLGSDAEEASDVGRGETSIDGVQGMALLHWASREAADPTLSEIATRHALRHIELCVRADGSVCQSASFDPTSGRFLRRYTHKGSAPDSTWARAQAWGMLGYAVNAVWRPDVEEFGQTAMRIADWWIDHVPADRVPFWDFDVRPSPGVERDTSGAAIAAAALLKLAEIAPAAEIRERYRSIAEETVSELVGRYLTPTSDDDRRPAGILTHGCYNRRTGLAVSNELVWGSYYLFEALLVLSGAIRASDV
jgi:unsaturated chondroitin disaccharide hydrolase